jgi:hypothetical protein
MDATLAAQQATLAQARATTTVIPDAVLARHATRCTLSLWQTCIAVMTVSRLTVLDCAASYLARSCFVGHGGGHRGNRGGSQSLHQDRPRHPAGHVPGLGGQRAAWLRNQPPVCPAGAPGHLCLHGDPRPPRLRQGAAQPVPACGQPSGIYKCRRLFMVGADCGPAFLLGEVFMRLHCAGSLPCYSGQ